MVGEIREGIEGKVIRRMAQIVVLGNKGEVFLEHTEPVELFLG